MTCSKRTNEDNLITEYDNANMLMPTQYGRIKYVEWLKHEKRRFARLGVKAEIVGYQTEDRGYRVALEYIEQEA